MKKLSFFLLCFLLFISSYSQNKPTLSDKNSFSMILLPDPQSYTKFDTNQPIFELMTAWVASVKKNLAVKAVLCTGDLVEQNECLVPDNVNGNQTSEEQWKAASRAFERLDHRLPYIICGGNHDYGYKRAENRLCNISKYFPVTRNLLWKDCLVSVCNNAFGVPTLENAAYEFTNKNWGNILVIVLEFAPRDEVLEWAKSLLFALGWIYYRKRVLWCITCQLWKSYLGKTSLSLQKHSYDHMWSLLLYKGVCI